MHIGGHREANSSQHKVDCYLLWDGITWKYLGTYYIWTWMAFGMVPAICLNDVSHAASSL